MKSFGPDSVHVPWTQRASGDQVYRPAEGGLELVGERHEIEADLGADVDEDVDVASVGLVAARKRAEQGQVAHAEPSTEVRLHRPKGREDLVAGSNHEEASLSESRRGGRTAAEPSSRSGALGAPHGSVRSPRRVERGRMSRERRALLVVRRGLQDCPLVPPLALFPFAAADLCQTSGTKSFSVPYGRGFDLSRLRRPSTVSA